MATTPEAEVREQDGRALPALPTLTPPTKEALHDLIDILADEELLDVAQLLDGLAARVSDPKGQALTERWIERNPHKPWLDEVRIVGFGVPVWALVGHLGGVGGDAARTAAAYELPREAVEAALAFYRRHRAVIDARIAANTAEADDPV